MSKLLLFSILGMIFLIGIVGAGLIYDSVRDEPLEETDKAVLSRAGITDYTLVKIDKGDYIYLKINDYTKTINKFSHCYQMKQLYPNYPTCKDTYKTEEEIQREITAFENSWLQRQKDNQIKKETASPKAPETKTTELVTITEAKDGEIGVVLK